jgi:hypothetical protein
MNGARQAWLVALREIRERARSRALWTSVLVTVVAATAPMAMPNRIPMGATAWWEPVAAAALTLVAIAGLVQFAGRVYTHAILHGGPALKLRDAWRGAAATGTLRAGAQPRTGSRRRRLATPPTPAMKPRARGPGHRGRSYLHR